MTLAVYADVTKTGKWNEWGVTVSGGGTGGGGGHGVKGFVGAYVNPTMFGSGVTLAQGITDFQVVTKTTLKARRLYYGPVGAGNAMPTGGVIDNGLTADSLAGRKVCMSFRPAFNPTSATERSQLDAYLAAAVAGGVHADVALYPEPNNCGLNASQCKAAFAFYGPTVRKYYPLVFNTSSFFDTNSDPSHTFYPGDSIIDKVTTDIYCSEFNGGQRLDDSAEMANLAISPKPFGIWEFNSSTAATPTGQTQAQAQTFFTYLQNYMTGRISAGLNNADILLFNSATTATQETPIITSSDYRIPMYTTLMGALSA